MSNASSASGGFGVVGSCRRRKKFRHNARCPNHHPNEAILRCGRPTQQHCSVAIAANYCGKKSPFVYLFIAPRPSNRGPAIFISKNRSYDEEGSGTRDISRAATATPASRTPGISQVAIAENFCMTRAAETPRCTTTARRSGRRAPNQKARTRTWEISRGVSSHRASCAAVWTAHWESDHG